jgi:hypothetical protein
VEPAAMLDAHRSVLNAWRTTGAVC